MKVLVVGASGLVGAAVVARLKEEQHDVTAVHHRKRQRGAGLSLELGTTSEEEWSTALRGHDAIVNCAGVFQDNRSDSTDAVHRAGVAALVRAAEQTGIRRLIHFSAIGMDRQQPTEFSRSKHAGDRIVEHSDLDWVILRPSVILGNNAYGGSALFRGLAALPVLPRLKGAERIQPVQLDDVVATVSMLLQPESPSRVALELAGPQAVTVEEVVASYRGWLGHRPARTVRCPNWLLNLVYAAGDFAGWLGWRPPVRTTARIEMQRGAVGDNSAWRTVTRIDPKPLAEALASTPASIQEKWFSNLYLLKALVFGIFALFWITTGLISLGPGWERGMEILREGGLAPSTASLAITAGALADIVIGLGIAFRRTARLALWGALAISTAYAIIGTILVPALWLDPLGPMLKIWPIMVLNLVALAILEDR